MKSRRAFLQVGIAASSLPLTGRAAALAVNNGRADADGVPLYAALYDVRFPESVAFARRASALGVRMQAIEGDVTRFWYDDLYHQWQRGPAAIAGLTAHAALFCLERLAWDRRLRVVFRAEHRSAPERVVHTAKGPVPMLALARECVTAASWAEVMADVVTQCPAGRAEIAELRAESAPAALASIDTETLFSWVIARPARAR